MPSSLPRADFLDPRSAGLAAQSPISRSVNIPAAALAQRRDELPAAHRKVCVCAGVDGAEQAEEWLQSHGWTTEPSRDWSYRTEAEPRFRLWSPNPLLEQWLASAEEPGHALDLGCGGGREAVALAAEGRKVLALDRLEENLHRGFQLANRYLEREEDRLIAWEKQDVLGPAWRPIMRYDLILSFFLFDARLIASAADCLVDGGTLLLEAFTPRRRESHGRPASPYRVVDPDALPSLLRGVKIETLEVVAGPAGETVRLAGRRLN